MPDAQPIDILLVEPANLLRRTVSLTVRSLGTARITEAATYPSARELCELRRFDGAVIAVEWPAPGGEDDGFALLQRIRRGQFACAAAIPIAVLVESCNAELLQVLRTYDISRVLIKPFRARDVIDTVNDVSKRARAVQPAAAPAAATQSATATPAPPAPGTPGTTPPAQLA